jgi:hypothetical protein
MLQELRNQFFVDGLGKLGWQWNEWMRLDKVAPKAAAYFSTIEAKKD